MTPIQSSFDRTQLDDGLITGVIIEHRIICGACGALTLSIWIDKITLPPTITPLLSFVLYKLVDGDLGLPRTLQPLNYIGITCGCYAKAHRQIAHIQTTRKARRRK